MLAGRADNVASLGRVPKWTKGTDCKSVIRGFESHLGLYPLPAFQVSQPTRRTTIGRFAAALVVAVAFALAGAAWGHVVVERAIQFIMGAHRQDVRVDPGDVRKVLPSRAAAAGAFLGAAVVIAAVISRPGASMASLGGRVVLFAAVAAGAFVVAATHERSKFAAFVQEAIGRQQFARLPEERKPVVQLREMPIVRMPVIAGAAAITAGALMRSISKRSGSRKPDSGADADAPIEQVE